MFKSFSTFSSSSKQSTGRRGARRPAADGIPGAAAWWLARSSPTAPGRSGTPPAGGCCEAEPHGGRGTGTRAWGSHGEPSPAVSSQRGSWGRTGAAVAEEQAKAMALLGLSGVAWYMAGVRDNGASRAHEGERERRRAAAVLALESCGQDRRERPWCAAE